MIAQRYMHKAASVFGACCMLLALAVFSSAPWAQSKNGREASSTNSGCRGGYVHEVSGFVSEQSAGAKAVPAKAGDIFESDTVFRTGTDGKAVILKFADGQVVVLGPNSTLRVVRYCYNPGSPMQSTSTLELMKGEMRIVTGLIGAANPEGMRVIAGNSVIGILSQGGADFTVVVNPDPQETGAAVVARGQISVRTPYGPISKIDAGQYAPWQPGRSPPLPMPFAAAPAVMQAAVAALWATVLPASTPVEVASAARTAAVVAGPTQTPAAVDGSLRLAGYVEAISNAVSIRTTPGRTAAANVGTTFEAGATFTTGKDGRAVLKFADGEVVVLGPDSNLAVAQYEFDPSNVRASKSALDLSSGTMRVITGSIQTENHDGISISSGASIIDILNNGPADFYVAVNTRNKDGEFGIARVTLGEISVHTPYGPINKINRDESAPWGPKTATSATLPPGTGLALVESIAALQVPKLPDSEPVAVAAAASAAAAVAEAGRAQAAASANPANAQLQAEAKAATELANLATQTANAASQAVAATIFASALTNLPATAAGPALGPALAQVAGAPTPPAPPTATVTPGAGGGKCVGSPC